MLLLKKKFHRLNFGHLTGEMTPLAIIYSPLPYILFLP